MRLFDRAWRVTARRPLPLRGAGPLDASFFETQDEVLEITQARVRFSIEKTLGKTPNTCELEIFNLAEETRTALVRKPLRVFLEAGYDDAPTLLFSGDLRWGESLRDGVDWQTKLLLGDGARAYAQARINRAYAKGTPLLTVLRDAASAIGLALPNEATSSDDLRSQLAAGESLSGLASDELTRLLAPYGYEWSIQDGRLQVLRNDQVRASTARVISEEDSGMLATPELGAPDLTSKKPKAPTITIRHLLYPEIVPGDRIEVRSRVGAGAWKVQKVRHEGDSEGEEWQTTIEGVPAS